MQDLNDKINNGGATAGGQLDAEEWNQPASEIQNIIEALGITLSGADLNQLGKAIAGYVANGNFYTDSGAVNAYVLSSIGSKQSVHAYTEGAKFSFIAGTTGTGAATANIAGLGVLNIKLRGGVTDPSSGDISSSSKNKLIYRSTPSAHLELDRSGMSKTVIFGSSGTYTPPSDVKSIEITCIGGGGGGGGVDTPDAFSLGGSSGGGAGGVSKIFTSLIEASYAIVVGTGGAGGVGSVAGAGGNGVASTVISALVTMTSNGGNGGAGVTAEGGGGITFSAAGTGGIATVVAGGGFAGTSEGYKGSSGGMGSASASSVPDIGAGGGNQYSSSIDVNTVNTAGQSADDGCGAGGSGAGIWNNASVRNGGAGAAGSVIIKEFF